MTPTPPLSARIASLPRNAAGIPVPYFVAWVDGRPDFRVVDAHKLKPAVRQRLCWLCGQQLGRMMCFVVGPMCVVNRVSSEPPMHRDCAEYALQVCPFLTRPHAVRREAGLPESAMAGIPIMRNPGVSALYVTRSFAVSRVPNGVLFDMGVPQEVAWWAHGRLATRAEVEDSLATGLPALQEIAEHHDGPDGVAALAQAVSKALELLPAEDVA